MIYSKQFFLLTLITVSPLYPCQWMHRLFHKTMPVVALQTSTLNRVAKQLFSPRSACIALGVAFAVSIVYAIHQHKQATKNCSLLKQAQQKFIAHNAKLRQQIQQLTKEIFAATREENEKLDQQSLSSDTSSVTTSSNDRTLLTKIEEQNETIEKLQKELQNISKTSAQTKLENEAALVENTYQKCTIDQQQQTNIQLSDLCATNMLKEEQKIFAIAQAEQQQRENLAQKLRAAKTMLQKKLGPTGQRMKLPLFRSPQVTQPSSASSSS